MALGVRKLGHRAYDASTADSRDFGCVVWRKLKRAIVLFPNEKNTRSRSAPQLWYEMDAASDAYRAAAADASQVDQDDGAVLRCLRRCSDHGCHFGAVFAFLLALAKMKLIRMQTRILQLFGCNNY
jgi:hypothetical protein